MKKLSSALSSLSGQMRVGEVELHVERYGKGQPLVALHGGPGLNLEPFKPTLPLLTDRNEIVLYDQRGCGRSASGPPEKLCDIATHITDLENLRKACGFESMSLLGHSYGAYLAIAYAATHPQRIRSLILICPTPPRQETPEELHSWHKHLSSNMRREIGNISKSKLPLNKKANKRLRIILPLYFARTETLEEFHRRDIQISGIMAERCGPVLMQRDLRPAVADLTMPVSILAGAEDLRTPPAYAGEIAALAPTAQLTVMDGVGHFPFMERPNAFLAFMREALGRETSLDDTAKG